MSAIAIDNLAAFGVEEIDSETVEQIEGGFWGALALGIAGSIAAHILVEWYNDAEAAGAAFSEGFNSVG